MQAKAKWLNAQAKKNDGEEGAWTAQQVQLCLYAEFRDSPDATKKKTKRAVDPPTAMKGKKAATSDEEKDEDEKSQTRKRRKTMRS